MLPTVSTLLGDDCEKYPIEICKGAWAIMINGFLRGGSCATWELIETMLSWVNSKGKILVDFDKDNPGHEIFVLSCLTSTVWNFPLNIVDVFLKSPIFNFFNKPMHQNQNVRYYLHTYIRNWTQQNKRFLAWFTCKS